MTLWALLNNMRTTAAPCRLCCIGGSDSQMPVLTSKQSTAFKACQGQALATKRKLTVTSRSNH
eukprot:4110622-Amphidinium_carterae.1